MRSCWCPGGGGPVGCSPGSIGACSRGGTADCGDCSGRPTPVPPSNKVVCRQRISLDDHEGSSGVRLLSTPKQLITSFRLYAPTACIRFGGGLVRPALLRSPTAGSHPGGVGGGPVGAALPGLQLLRVRAQPDAAPGR